MFLLSVYYIIYMKNNVKKIKKKKNAKKSGFGRAFIPYGTDGRRPECVSTGSNSKHQPIILAKATFTRDVNHDRSL